MTSCYPRGHKRAIGRILISAFSAAAFSIGKEAAASIGGMPQPGLKSGKNRFFRNEPERNRLLSLKRISQDFPHPAPMKDCSHMALTRPQRPHAFRAAPSPLRPPALEYAWGFKASFSATSQGCPVRAALLTA